MTIADEYDLPGILIYLLRIQHAMYYTWLATFLPAENMDTQQLQQVGLRICDHQCLDR
ncbi:MAG: hypothetical protein ACPH3C_07505 [Glaciecola sp.]